MYAVALVINLPQGTSSLQAARAAARGPGSYTEQDSFPSSYGSARRSGWSMVGTGLGIDSLDAAAYASDLEERFDPISQHWDIIMRTLTHLQSVVATTVLAMLKQADMASPDPFSSSASSYVSRTPSLSGRRSEDGSSVKPPKTNAKIVALLPNCLMDNGRVKSEVDSSRTRIVTGLRASRVITGQNRWGIWREEARWVARWAGGKDQDFFFFNLLTGFLATHTDWLQALGPSWYRRRHFQQKAKADDDMSIPGRTVIVAHDKIAARRLIFLLSAFLPASQPLPSASAGRRPSTSASLGAFSQSPPSSYVVPILKEESLRRKINRRTGPRRPSHSRNVSLQGQNPRSSGVPPYLAHLSIERGHERRSSDTPSVKAANLPIPSSDANTRKSSAATAATVTQEATIAHFTTLQKMDSSLHARPGSANSVAADDLKRTLQRGDSSGQYSGARSDSRQGSRWGSVISGLWNTRRRDSTHSTATQARDSISSRGSSGPPTSPTKARRRGSDQLARMVREAEPLESPIRDQPADMASAVEGVDPQTPRFPDDSPDLRAQHLGPEGVPRTPDPTGAYESPVKTSINAQDGVIDVDVPFPDYLTSFETAVSSPSSSGYLSHAGFGSALEAFEQSCRVSVEGDVPTNVAGWLPRYHPDFVLQAIPPQGYTMEQIKSSLRAEPSPAAASAVPSYSPAEALHGPWVEISSVIVADATKFTVVRLRYYRRLLRPPKAAFDRAAAPYNPAVVTPAVSPPYETQVEEEIVEEPITTLEEVLAEAVERVIAHSSGISKGSSNCSSRSASVRRDRSNSEPLEPDEAAAAAAAAGMPSSRLPPPPQHEVPRGECKTVVLSALEEIVRDMVNEREHDRPEGHRAQRCRHQGEGECPAKRRQGLAG